MEKETYLLALSRYIVLNPVRAGLVATAEDWKWSSYGPTISRESSLAWLDTGALLAHFGSDRQGAIAAFRQFVNDGAGIGSPLDDVSHQLFLGSSDFVRMHQYMGTPDEVREVPRQQRRAGALQLHEYESRFPDRQEAMARAYATTAYSMTEIGRHFGVSRQTVSQAVSSFEKH
mgnify:FL=1